MTANCTRCGAPLAPDARFCAQCGTPVAAAADVAWPTTVSERPATGAPVPQGAEWHAEDDIVAGDDEEYYPEDFPEHLSADAGRQVMAGASYPTEPPPAYARPAAGRAGYPQSDYGPPDYGLESDEPAHAAGGLAGRGEGLGSPWQEPDGGRSRALLVGAAVLIGLLVLIGLVYFLLFRPGSSPTAALPPASPVASAPSASSPPPATVSTPPGGITPPSPSQPAYPAVVLPAGSTICPAAATGAYAHAAAGTTFTSCEFATAVRAAYVPVAAPGGSVVVQATSPRTARATR